MEVDGDGQEAVAKVSARSKGMLKLSSKQDICRYSQLYGVCGGHGGDEVEFELWPNSVEVVRFAQRQSCRAS